MSYLALARKYRPRRFGEVATQEHVSETLRRAVAGGRVGHAYLLCGPRGVGKTTLARILAMSLNCAGRTAEGEPCGTCENCNHIWGGHTSLDVVEIDAASNRGVEDARELRARAMLAPSEEDRYKVYILDEAHMLTREAWNALLKILEEPPPRVIFCFATTEARRIQQSASPILSRCQRFDFRRIGTDDIMKRLGEVLEAEGIGFDPEALRAIARKANGGMRDGLSLLDQVLALSDQEVKVEAVVRVLGVVAEERYLQILDVILERRHGAVFDFVEELLDEGHDLVEFYHGLTERLRLLLRIALDGGAAPVMMAGEHRDAYAQRAAGFAPGDLVRMLALASGLEADGSLRRTGRPRVMVEMLLLRMSYLDRTVELEDIIRSLGGVPAREPAPPAAPPPSPPAAPEPAPPATIDLAAAWHALLDDRERMKTLPRGVSPFLRAATARASDGVLVLELPAGPGEARLRQKPVLRALEEGLALHAGRDSAEISIVGGTDEDGADGGRVTEDSVRRTRLRELVKRAPHLERAVDELELDLVD
ncbi:MAG: DNA polymerase III subunit gamma/tau [Gemmatimonadota bacterium]|nr:DNA polymerase III subunit gamma/tau [Gemmatimonadota bacterium]